MPTRPAPPQHRHTHWLAICEGEGLSATLGRLVTGADRAQASAKWVKC